MITPQNLIKELKRREDDSKRIDAILEAMKTSMGYNYSPMLFVNNKCQIVYDHDAKIFVAGSAETRTEEFYDGREAIDFCLENDLSESKVDEISSTLNLNEPNSTESNSENESSSQTSETQLNKVDQISEIDKVEEKE